LALVVTSESSAAWDDSGTAGGSVDRASTLNIPEVFVAGSATTRELQLERGAELFDAIVRMASGQRMKSEGLGLGAEEIAPWKLGAVL
jgi:hypothetical protein